MTDLQVLVLALALCVGSTCLGEIIGTLTPLLRRVFLPGAVIGGAVALCAGPQVNPLAGGSSAIDAVYDQASAFPALFINIVFACLMLGKPIAALSKIWSRARPMIIMGHVYAWGQYVVGLTLALAVLGPVFGVSPLAGATIAIGFQGGHGTSAGLSGTFDKLGFADGATVAYSVATVGIILGAIGGPLLATRLTRRAPIDDEDDAPQADHPAGGEGDRPETEAAVEFSPLTGKLTLHLALIGAVIATAWLLLRAAQWAERGLRPDDAETLVTAYVPLFSVTLITGLAFQLALQRLRLHTLVNRAMVESLSAFALDVVIVSAIATLSLKTAGEQWPTILILCAGGAAWNLGVFFLLGPRVYPRPWYPHGLADLGGGTATTASGLLLVRIADRSRSTPALRAYAEKQPFYEPLMGGGLVTALALPVIAHLGAAACLAITAAIVAALLLAAWRSA